MFEDSLLIIKHDYVVNRVELLQKLMEVGFLLQATRKILFSPELAVEFLKISGIPDDSHFMNEVRSLSKGYSEAIVVTKENAVEHLWDTLLCHFGSTEKMEPNVFVSKVPDIIRKDITYIFPNYTHEPVQVFDQQKFRQQEFIKPLIAEMHDIAQGSTCLWKSQLAKWFALNNRNLPQVSNVCSTIASLRAQDKAQQTSITIPKDEPLVHHPPCELPKVVSSSQAGVSSLITSSSCISCSSFVSTCPKPSSDEEPYPVHPEMLSWPETESESEPESKTFTPSTVEEEEEEYVCPESEAGEEQEVPLVTQEECETDVPEAFRTSEVSVKSMQLKESAPVEADESENLQVSVEPEEGHAPSEPEKPEEVGEPEKPAGDGLIDGEERVNIGDTEQTEQPLEGEHIKKDNEEPEALAAKELKLADTEVEATEIQPEVKADSKEAEPVPPAEGDAEPAPAAEGEAEPAPTAEGEAAPAPTAEGEAEPSPTAEGEAEPAPTAEGEAEPASLGEAEPAPPVEG